MTPDDVKDFYGTGYAFNKATGMSAASLGNWLRWGFVPTFSQLKLEKLTDKKLKAEWDTEKNKNTG